MWNKYDYLLFFLIFSIIGGTYAVPLQPSRLLAILFAPQLVLLIVGRKCKFLDFFISFFVLWLFYGLISFFWTPDLDQAVKDFFSCMFSFTYFLELLAFAKFANNPLMSISLGWGIGFFVTSLFAICELFLDYHLPKSKIKADSYANLGNNIIVLRRFASVTFGNTNYYVSYICMAFPFLFYLLNNKKTDVFFICLIAMAFVIVGFDASRGGIVSLIGMLSIYIFLSKEKKILFVLLPFLLVNFFNSDAFIIMFTKMGSLHDGRTDIWIEALKVLKSFVFIGTGMGGIEMAMRNESVVHVFAPHNLFIEMLVQFGFVVFIPFIVFLCFLFKESVMMKNNARRNVLLPALIMMPIYFIINSWNLLSPQTVALFASLYVYVSYESIRSID